MTSTTTYLYVGIGTATPYYQLDVVGTIRGSNSDTGLVGYPCPVVSGVFGIVTDTLGFGAGVRGESLAFDGRGVCGNAPGYYGLGVSGYGSKGGVRGIVYNFDDTRLGDTYGVKGRNDYYDPAYAYLAAGVNGINTSYYGVTAGVFGKAISNVGVGVLGRTYAYYGGVGVYGQSGVAPALSSISTYPYYGYGVVGHLVQDYIYGAGVKGISSDYLGYGVGVLGIGYSYFGYGVYSIGNLGVTGVKNFIQPHPTDASKVIAFTSLEGEESGTYFRGTTQLVDGEAVIEVPENFRLATDPDQLLTVQLTALGPGGLLWVASKDLQRIVLRGSNDVALDYFVNGVRRGFSEHRSVRKNRAFVPRVRGVPFGSQYPEKLRALLVANGTLNPDFTPNEETAARLSWNLKDAPQTSRVLARTAGRPGSVGRAGRGNVDTRKAGPDDGASPVPPKRRR